MGQQTKGVNGVQTGNSTIPRNANVANHLGPGVGGGIGPGYGADGAGVAQLDAMGAAQNLGSLNRQKNGNGNGEHHMPLRSALRKPPMGPPDVIGGGGRPAATTLVDLAHSGNETRPAEGRGYKNCRTTLLLQWVAPTLRHCWLPL